MSAKKKASFEEDLAQLEQTVARLEQGEMELDESLAAYAQAAKLLASCYSTRQKAQEKIEEVALGEDTNGL